MLKVNLRKWNLPSEASVCTVWESLLKCHSWPGTDREVNASPACSYKCMRFIWVLLSLICLIFGASSACCCFGHDFNFSPLYVGANQPTKRVSEAGAGKTRGRDLVEERKRRIRKPHTLCPVCVWGFVLLFGTTACAEDCCCYNYLTPSLPTSWFW